MLFIIQYQSLIVFVFLFHFKLGLLIIEIVRSIKKIKGNSKEIFVKEVSL